MGCSHGAMLIAVNCYVQFKIKEKVSVRVKSDGNTWAEVKKYPWKEMALIYSCNLSRSLLSAEVMFSRTKSL